MSTGAMLIPLEESIEAASDEEAMQIAKRKALDYYKLEGNSISLQLRAINGKIIGNVNAPKDNASRLCESCLRKNLEGQAHYREIFNDGTGTDVCDQHLTDEKGRREWSSRGLLERVYDYCQEKEVNPITLQPFK